MRWGPPTKGSFRDTSLVETSRCREVVYVTVSSLIPSQGCFYVVKSNISSHYPPLFDSDTWCKVRHRHQCESLRISVCLQISAHQDPFLRSMAYWVLEDYSKALDTLLEHGTKSSSSGSTESKYDSGRIVFIYLLGCQMKMSQFIYRCILLIRFTSVHHISKTHQPNTLSKICGYGN